MGKRLHRIFEKDIPSRITSLCGPELNLVLRNKKTFHGKIIKTDKGMVAFADFLLGIHTFQVSEISEIIYDTESSF